MTSYIHALRSRLGRRKIPLIFASLCIRDDAGRLLWQRRGDSGVWGLPGGVLELDETLEQCARREAFEETGLETAVGRLLGIYSSPDFDGVYPNGDQVQQVTFCYASHALAGDLRGDGEETLELAWFPPPSPPPTFLWYRAMHADWLANRPQPAFAHSSAGAGRESLFAELAPLLNGQALIAPWAEALLPDGRRVGDWLRLGERLDATALRAAASYSRLPLRPSGAVEILDDPRDQETLPNGLTLRRVGVRFQLEVVES